MQKLFLGSMKRQVKGRIQTGIQSTHLIEETPAKS